MGYLRKTKSENRKPQGSQETGGSRSQGEGSRTINLAETEKSQGGWALGREEAVLAQDWLA